MSTDKMSIGDRMKEYYENPYKIKLPGRLPIIIRLDGKAFHTYTRNAKKPFDSDIIELMNCAARKVCEEIQGAKMAYVQSDEISVLIYPWVNNESQPWFGNDLQKIVSISAAYASVAFNVYLIQKDVNSMITNGQSRYFNHEYPVFDSRAFVMPEHDVVNYFIWRQQDWFRNSIQMLAQSLYSHKELHGKKKSELMEMCFQKGHNWAMLDEHLKNGTIIKPDGNGIFHNEAAPIFTEGREYIEHYLKHEINEKTDRK